jgi:glycerophosphoryl diester phosphodiesterase
LTPARAAPASRPPGTGTPLVVAHRGASGHRPEHTLAAYELAIDLGADFIEPDLVSTKDGVLVARHENHLAPTTDVADRPELAHRLREKVVDGVPVRGWFVEDLTLAELKTLRCRERRPHLRPESAAHDGRYQIPTLQEVIDLAKRRSRRGRRIGLYPETKHPTYFAALGLALEEPLVAALHANGYRGPGAPVFLQSFEAGSLKELRRRTRLPLVQLLAASGRPYDLELAGDPRTYADLAAPEGLAEIAAYARGIGPDKELIVPRDAAGRLLAPTPLVAEAHARGLAVHAFTFRNENWFLPLDLRRGDPEDPGFPGRHGDAAAELRLFFDLGTDGVFADFPEAAVAVRAERSR